MTYFSTNNLWEEVKSRHCNHQTLENVDENQHTEKGEEKIDAGAIKPPPEDWKPRPSITGKTEADETAKDDKLATDSAKQAIAKSEPEDFCLDRAEPISPMSFPNAPTRSGTKIPATIPNLVHMLKEYGIKVRYDAIKKKLLIMVPGLITSVDNADNVALTHILSLATLNGMSTGQVPNLVVAIGDRDLYNPAADWICSKPWDGVDRLQEFFDTLTERDDFPSPLKEACMYRWLLGAVAAALTPRSGFHNRGVLTIQGPQSIGKTAFVSSLIPDQSLRENLILLDHHLDASNKDSILLAVSHWIVEIGELDSSFKRDPGRLKGFLTKSIDKVRRPYAPGDSEYARRTVFCATVNEGDFLVDLTGNTRFWTIPVTKVNYEHDIDMQQLFAQVAEDFRKGEQWWLTRAEEECLEKHNRHHMASSMIRDSVLEAIDPERKDQNGLPAMTPTAVLQRIGIELPTNSQAKECAAILREHLGDAKRINGQNKWRIPFVEQYDMEKSSRDLY